MWQEFVFEGVRVVRRFVATIVMLNQNPILMTIAHMMHFVIFGISVRVASVISPNFAHLVCGHCMCWY